MPSSAGRRAIIDSVMLDADPVLDDSVTIALDGITFALSETSR